MKEKKAGSAKAKAGAAWKAIRRTADRYWQRLKEWLNDPANRTARQIAASLLLLIGASAVMSATVLVVRGLLTDLTSERTNEFATMTYTNIDITEPGGDYTVAFDINTFLQEYNNNNGVISKEARITNSTGNDRKPVYVRAKVIMTIYDSDGYNITGLYASGENPVSYEWSPPTASKWQSNGGYWYYKSILLPGESTETLFSGNQLTVTNAAYLPDNCTIHIDILADAVQAVSTDTIKWTAADYYKAESIAEVRNAWGITPTPESVADSTQQVATGCTWASI